MIERRTGGESGVVAVQCLEGEAVWQAGEEGRWSPELATAACAPIPDKPEGNLQDHCENPAVFLLEHSDGFRSAVLMLNGYISDFAYAGQINGEIQGVQFRLQGGGPHAHFSYLSLNIEEMFLTRVPQYPVERTLLTTGVLDAAMRSRYEGHTRLETPHLADLSYRSYEQLPVRPMGPEPSGSTLDPWPPDAPDS